MEYKIICDCGKTTTLVINEKDTNKLDIDKLAKDIADILAKTHTTNVTNINKYNYI